MAKPDISGAMDRDHLDAELTLRRVGFDQFLDLEKWFEDPALQWLAVRRDSVQARRLYGRVFASRHLLVWELTPAGSNHPVGLVTLRHQVPATAQLTLFFFDGVCRPDMVERVVRLLAVPFFEVALAPAIDFLAPLPLESDLEERLTSLGFYRDTIPDLDPEIEALFRLHVSGYDSYLRDTQLAAEG